MVQQAKALAMRQPALPPVRRDTHPQRCAQAGARRESEAKQVRGTSAANGSFPLCPTLMLGKRCAALRMLRYSRSMSAGEIAPAMAAAAAAG